MSRCMPIGSSVGRRVLGVQSFGRFLAFDTMPVIQADFVYALPHIVHTGAQG